MTSSNRSYWNGRTDLTGPWINERPHDCQVEFQDELIDAGESRLPTNNTSIGSWESCRCNIIQRRHAVTSHNSLFAAFAIWQKCLRLDWMDSLLDEPDQAHSRIILT